MDTNPAGVEMPGMFLYSPRSTCLCIFNIFTLFGPIKNKFMFFVHLFRRIKSCFFHTLISKFLLEFPKKNQNDETDANLHHQWCRDCYRSISFPTFSHFCVLFCTGDQICLMPLFGAPDSGSHSTRYSRKVALFRTL